MNITNERKRFVRKDLKLFLALMISFGIAGTVVFLIGVNVL